MRTRGDLQADIELRRRSGGTIDLLGRRRGQGQARTLARGNIDIKIVPAGNAAGRVDEHAGEALAFRRGKADAQGAGFMQDPSPRHAVARVDVEAHYATGAVGFKHRRCR
ncbi:hypothetical protein ACVWW7_004528 [Bradyrhizobium sp. LM6.9]